jgi:preprotein translocase subunit SecG
MTVLLLSAIPLVMRFVAVLFVLVSIILILVVLMQKGRGGGLSGAFGGGMASGLLGSKTGDFLTWVTVGLVSVFLVLAVLMARYYKPSVQYGADLPQATQQPVPTGQPATPPAGTSGQTAPLPAPQPEATSPAAQPSAPASQPSTPQPDAGGAGAQPAPSAETGKTGN